MANAAGEEFNRRPVEFLGKSQFRENRLRLYLRAGDMRAGAIYYPCITGRPEGDWTCKTTRAWPH